MTQLDLFLDSRSVQACNALRLALGKRDSAGARRAHDELAAADAAHRWLPCAGRLIEALESPAPADPEAALGMLCRLRSDWTQAAQTILGAEHEVLVPVWRAVGDALEGGAFDPEHPARHASYAWMRGEAWAGEEQCIRNVPDYRSEPALLARMAEAAWHQRHGAEAIDHWFALCWLAPEAFRRLMECGDVPDPCLKQSGERCGDQDVEPAISPAWFPAWVLVDRPQLARSVAEAEGTGAAKAAFNTLLALETGSGPAAGLRRRLQRLHPGLLALLLARQ
ncbi:MAG: hypothetical protein OXF98_07070 [Rhodospirillaceae bacterium]|nr:hypothetical protein [Rhodospirillaceae bacterium]